MATMDDAPTEFEHLEDAEHEALRKWAWSIYRRGRKADAFFNGDTGKSTPSEAEAPRVCRDGHWIRDLTPRVPSYFTGWQHVWQLCASARAGDLVPMDIATSYADEFGKFAEKFLTQAVNDRLKSESEAHAKERRRIAKQAAAAEKASPRGRLTERVAALARLDKLIAKRLAQVKALRTRRSRVLRSITMLKKSAAKDGR